MKSILLVEDDPFFIDIYTTKLKDVGFSMEVAENGEKCLKLLAEKKFDLLLLDIVLPQIDGWEILNKIKNEELKIKNNFKIIILSNLSQKDEVEKGLKLGADKYFIKAHYTPSEIIKEIKEILK